MDTTPPESAGILPCAPHGVFPLGVSKNLNHLHLPWEKTEGSVLINPQGRLRKFL